MNTIGKACSLLLLFIVAGTTALFGQAYDSEANGSGKVCVAAVTNMSTGNAVVERMTERLSTNLKQSHIDAVTMESSTTTQRKLQPTGENREEAKTKECDYVLLTQVVNRKAGSLEQPTPTVGISVGRPGPGLDASDPMHPSPFPVHRDDLLIGFALFRIDRPKSVVDTQIAVTPSGQGPESLTPAMDRESSRVVAELKKK